ncbi:MAG: hypothetical protein IH984_04545 [Planctomycetes bacterium]|nr:hypothetical protein [Planctomycetota bacterium]
MGFLEMVLGAGKEKIKKRRTHPRAPSLEGRGIRKAKTLTSLRVAYGDLALSRGERG